jgi:flagellin-like protein
MGVNKMEDKASIKIGIVFGMVFLLLMAAIVVFIPGSGSGPVRTLGRGEPVMLRADEVVPFIDIDDNSTSTDHDGLKIIYKSTSVPGASYAMKKGESRNANIYEKATIRCMLNGEGDSVAGGDGGYGPVDCVFVCDDTGSMSSKIAQAASDMNNIISGLEDNGVTDMRFGIVTFKDGDHDARRAWQDCTAVSGAPKNPPSTSIGIDVGTDLYLTSNKPAFVSKLSSLTSSGGADGPEAYVDGLQYAYDTWRHWDDIHQSRATVTKKYTNNDTMNWDLNRNGHKVAKVVVFMSDAPAHAVGAALENASDAYDEFGITTNTIQCATYANTSYYTPCWTSAPPATAGGGCVYDLSIAGQGVFSLSNNPTYMANKISESILRVAERLNSAGKSVNLTYDVASHITVSTMSDTPLLVDTTPGGTWNPITGIAQGPVQIIWHFGDTYNVGEQKSVSWDVSSSKPSAVHATSADVEFGDLTLSYYAWNQGAKKYNNFVSVKMGEGYLASDDPLGTPELWEEKKLMVKAINKIEITATAGPDQPIYTMAVGGKMNFDVKDVIDQLGLSGNSIKSYVDLDQLRWDTNTDAGTCNPVKCTDTPTEIFTTQFTCAGSGRIACTSTSGVIGQKLISVPEILAGLTIYTKEDTTTPARDKTISVTVDKTQTFVAKGFSTAGTVLPLVDPHWTAVGSIDGDITASALSTTTGSEVTMTAPHTVQAVTLTCEDYNGTATWNPGDPKDSCLIQIDAGGVAHIIVIPRQVKTGGAIHGYWPAPPTSAVAKTLGIQTTQVEAGDNNMQFKAYPFDEYWNYLGGSISYTWTSDVGSMAPAQGTTSFLNGQQTLDNGYVYASKNGINGRCQVEIIPGPLAKIEVIPDLIAIQVGNDYTFTAKGYDAAGNLKTDWKWDAITTNWAASDGSAMNKLGAGYEYTAPTYLPYKDRKEVTIFVNDSVSNPLGLVSGSATVIVMNPFDIWIEYAEVGPFAVLTDDLNVELYAILHWNIPSALFATTSFVVDFEVDGSSVGTVTVDSPLLVVEEGKMLISVPWSSGPVPSKHVLKVSFPMQDPATPYEASFDNNEVEKDMHVVEAFPRSTPSFNPGLPILTISLIALVIFAFVFGTDANRNIKKDKKGVSPVIAVILMVAITLVIIAILWLWISSMISDDKTEAPTIELEQGTTDDNDAYIITVKSIDDQTVSVLDLKFVLRDPEDQNDLNSVNKLKDIYGKPVSSGNVVVFQDNDYNGKVTANDQFKIYMGDTAGMPGGHFKLVYTPSNSMVNDLVLK